MSKIILEVEEDKIEQLMAVIGALKSDIITHIEIQQEDDERVDEQHCLEVLDKINRGDYSGFTPIGDIDQYILELKNAIS